MAIPGGYQFPIEFDVAFPQGLVLVGEVAPTMNIRRGRIRWLVGQKTDPVTGQRQWKATVTGPAEPSAKRVWFEVTFTADVQPVAPTAEVLPGMRPIALQGLTAEPKVAGNGEFKYQSYVSRATGFTAPTSAHATRPSSSSKLTGGEQTSKAA